jgi:hypothetical protein
MPTLEHETPSGEVTHTSSSTAPIDCRRRTISSLDPYTPRGLNMSWSNVLKSTLVIDAYAPGYIALMKRRRDSWSMMTLSTMCQISRAWTRFKNKFLPYPLLPDSLIRSRRRYIPLTFSAMSTIGVGVEAW